jgi:[acyl-carrier-protein] S-malonyltransferase
MGLDVQSIGLVFPGQGAQYVGMGRWLLDHHGVARDCYQRASEILGYDLAGLSLHGPAERLDATAYSQPALFVASVAAAEVLRREQPELIQRVRGAAGLSLGEYSALWFAGGLDFESALRLVQRRGQAMQAAADETAGAMASVIGMELDAVQTLCDRARGDDEVLQPANLLCRGNIAVSGHRTAVERFTPLALSAGATKVIPLAVAGAFHTQLMQPAAAALSEALAEVSLRELSLSVYSNVDAQPHRDGGDFRDLLSRQLIGPVLWEQSILKMVDDGIEGFLEVGTGRVLRGTIKRINRKLPTDGFGDGDGDA